MIKLPLQIDTISVSRAANAAHFEYMSTILRRLDETPLDNRTWHEAADEFRRAFEREDKAFKQYRASDHTTALREADEERDRLYASLRDTVNAYAAFPIAETAALAHPLQKVVKNYKITTRENYMKESALLDNLLQDLAPFTDQLRALGLLAIYEGLRNANDKVRHILTSRNDERSELVLGELKAARAEADQAYAAVVFFTNAYLAMNLDSQSALALIKHISEDLDYFRQHAMSKPNSNRDSQPEGETAPQDGEEAANV